MPTQRAVSSHLWHEAAAMDKSWGSGKDTHPLVKSWVTARNQDREDEQEGASREPQITPDALGVTEGGSLSHSGRGGSCIHLREIYHAKGIGTEFKEGEAGLPMPYGPGQHLNLGQEGPWQQETLG